MMLRSWRRVLATAIAVITPSLLAGQTITVLHVNDTHSRLDAFGPKDHRLDGTLGGLAKAATVIRHARAKAAAEGEGTLLLHAGDASVGDFFWNTSLAIPEIQILQSLGLDAMTLGNHELDLGTGALTQVMTAVQPPPSAPPFTLLSANVHTTPCGGTACDPLTKLIVPAKKITVEGVTIGIVGATTPDDPVAKTGVAPMTFDGGGTAVGDVLYWAGVMKAQGAQVVIVLSHLGLPYDQGIAASGANLVDFIVEGHDHTLRTTPLVIDNGVKKVRIVSAGEFYEHVGRLRFVVNQGVVDFLGYDLLPVGCGVKAARDVKAIVDRLKREIVAKYGDVYHTPIAFAPWNLEKTVPAGSQLRDSAMGDLVTDAFRKATKADVGLAATGFIAERIYRGPVVGADVFRPLAYGWDFVGNSGKDYPLVVAKMTGLQLLQGVGLGVSLLDQTEGLFMQVSGMRYSYVWDTATPPKAHLVPESVFVGKHPIDLSATYTVAANMMVVEIAKTLLQTQIPYQFVGYTEYDAALRWARRLKVLPYRPVGRITDTTGEP